MRLRMLVCLLLALTAASAHGQEDPPRELQQKVDGTIGVAEKTQQEQDSWARDRAGLEARYRAAQANIFYLNDRLEVEGLRGASLDEQVAELERRLSESTRLQSVINDTMRAVLLRLEAVVGEDQPFLAEERGHRLESLRRQMAQPEVAEAEKLRRLLEALLVEARYGETVEVTQESILIDGQESFVDLLRIGRLSLFWQTPDGKRTGTYDPVAGRYVDLPEGDRRSIKQAMEMASNMRVIELLSLPLGRIN